MSREPCWLSDCSRPHHARGLCSPCYRRFAANGIPFPRPSRAAPAAAAPPKRSGAADRYRRFLELDGLGWSARRIATEMNLSTRTIKRYRAGARQSTPPKEVTVTAKQDPIPGLGLDLADARHRDNLARHLLKVALHLACMVRDEEPAAVAAYLSELPQVERDHLPIILAALVDVDRTEEELLAWITWDAHGRALPGAPATPAPPTAEHARPRPLRPMKPVEACPSLAAAKRHREQGEPLCDGCRETETAYNRAYERNHRKPRKPRKKQRARTTRARTT
ncbi:hypothetical protein [Streptosporangium sp. NPDC002524]|uniref:hypothetical protein n=1 Tax=Streptosporangium sp. NPDC002524 TaxID=3154537 RepID=UPI00331D4F11